MSLKAFDPCEYFERCTRVKCEGCPYKKTDQQSMKYFEHMKSNLKVCVKCFVLFIFHFLHAILPFKITSHEYWGIK
jgi:hypothetical protein